MEKDTVIALGMSVLYVRPSNVGDRDNDTKMVPRWVCYYVECRMDYLEIVKESITEPELFLAFTTISLPDVVIVT